VASWLGKFAAGALAGVLMLVAAAPAPAHPHHRHAHHRRGAASLYPGPGPRPGPALLYRRPALAPPLRNRGIWKAPPILVSGASAYRDGEFLYQDYLYDDHGAHLAADPGDPQSQQASDLFSMPNGTYTYPSGPGYENNAADLVELRLKPLRRATAFRITLNTLADPALIAFTIAIGGRAGHELAFPFGANVRAPASLFLTVHPVRRRLVAVLTHAASGRAVRGPKPRVRISRVRHQIEVVVPHRDWNPRRHTVRLAAGVGLWDAGSDSYLLPQARADATHPGGAGADAHPAAFFNIAFRYREPLPSVTAGPAAVLDAAWWRDAAQAHALAAGDISPFYAEVSFAKLARRARDEAQVPRTGAFDRIVSSHFDLGPGASFAHLCGFGGAANPGSCQPEYLGQLQPYAVYVPPRPRSGRYGLTLLLHSLSANYNQFTGTRNQLQFAERAQSSIVITPEARGPDQFYEGYGATDVFEVWADVARRYRLDPAYTDIAGYSMGGIGTFKLAAEFPDLFARAQPTVGEESNNDVLASLRDVPVLMWNNIGDELVNVASFTATAQRLAGLGYRYELDAFQPCANVHCSPVFPNHLELAINDQYAPAAAFLGAARVDRDPARVTYVLDGARDRPALGLDADHAYWLSGLALRSAAHTSSSGDPEGEIDARSLGSGQGEPAVSKLGPPLGTLTGGNMGTLVFDRSGQIWGPAPPAPARDEIDITATNIAAAAVDVRRAHVDCRVSIKVLSTDGPIAISLPGCHRVVRAG
jgi:predicted esterase